MRRTAQIGDDVLDTRDIDRMIEDLEDDTSEFPDLEESPELEQLYELRGFKEQLENYCDWRHGATLVNEEYQVEYAKQLANDLGIMPDDMWPHKHIDWEAAAEDLFEWDWTCAEIEGVNYYVRS